MQGVATDPTMAGIAVAAKKPRQYRTQPQPVCPVHGVPMIAVSSPRGIRYCKCPCKGCKKTRKQQR